MAEQVNGIGGFFFRARNPAALSLWYRDNLGVSLIPEDYGGTPWMTESGPCAFAPFPEETDYFGARERMWMINFRVRNLDSVVSKLRDAGIAVDMDANAHPNGRFARLNDPEGKPVELWEPAQASA